LRAIVSHKVRAVLFDLDGTFADTAPDLAAALNHVRATRDLAPLPLAILRPQASHGSVGLLKVGMNITPDSPDFAVLREIFLQHYADNICVHTGLFDGIAELINQLDAREIVWGIVTNKPHRFTVPLMQAMGYAERAGCLISGDTCANAKPHPEPMQLACATIKIPAENCLYLGDDLRDMQAANAVNMRGIIANYGYVGADCSVANWQAHDSVNKPLELLGLIN
jgi:N-acetyl-D-muramate 6-phosphate phosphatase